MLSNQKENVPMVWDHYMKILKQQPFSTTENTSPNASVCDSDNVCVQYGELVINLLEAVCYFIGESDLKSKPTVVPPLAKDIINCVDPLLSRLKVNSNMKRTDVNFNESTLKNLVTCIKKTVNIESLGSLDEILSKFTSAKRNFVTVVKSYLRNTSFSDAETRNSIIRSILMTNGLLERLISATKKLIEETCSNKELSNRCEFLSLSLQELSFISSFREYLHELSKVNHDGLMPWLKEGVAENECKTKESAKDREAQMMKYDVSKLEKLYTLPLEVSLQPRQSFLNDLSERYVISQTVKSSLINAEILAIKFNIMTKIPSYVLQKSTRVLNWFNVLEMEFCLVVKKIIDKAMEISDRFQRYREELPDSDNRFSLIKTRGGVPFIEELDSFKSEMLDLKENQFSEAQKIGSILISQLRKDLIDMWTWKFNKRKKIDLEDLTCNFKGIQTLVEDILIMFKHVLPNLRKRWKNTSLFFNDDLLDHLPRNESFEEISIDFSFNGLEFIIINSATEGVTEIIYFMVGQFEESYKQNILTNYTDRCRERWPNNSIQTRSIDVENFLESSNNLHAASYILIKYLDNESFEDSIQVEKKLLGDFITNALCEDSIQLNNVESQSFISTLHLLSKFFNEFDGNPDLEPMKKEIQKAKEDLDCRYNSLLSSIKPETIVEKTQLLHFLNTNKEFSTVETVSDLKNKCISEDVIDCLVVCQMYNELQKTINIFRYYIFRGRSKSEALDFTFEVTKFFNKWITILVEALTLKRGFFVPSSTLRIRLKELETETNNFIRNHLLGKCKEIRFDIIDDIQEEALPKLNVKTERKSSSSNKHCVLSEKEVILKINQLRECNSKAFKLGFDRFFIKVTSLIKELSVLANTEIEIQMYHRLVNEVDSIIQEIHGVCEKVKKVKSADSLELPWMKQPHDLKLDELVLKKDQINESPKFDGLLLEGTDDEILNNESLKSLFGKSHSSFLSLYKVLKQNGKSFKGLEKWVELLKKPSDQNFILKGFIDNLVLYLETLDCRKSITAFDALMEGLRKCNSSKKALYLVDLSISLFEKGDKVLLIDNLKQLKTTVDKPACLMILSRLEMMIENEENFNPKDELLKLIEIMLKDRLKSLDELGFLSISSLTEFIFLGTSTDPVQLGLLMKSLQNLHQVAQSTEQQIFLCEGRQQSLLAKMEYIEIYDFVQFVTSNPEVSFNVFKKHEDVKAVWLTKDNFVNLVKTKFFIEDMVNENVVDDLANLSHQIVIEVFQKYQESDNSIATTVYTNVSILSFLSKYWSDFEKGLLHLDNIVNTDLNKTKLILLGKKSKDCMEKLEDMKTQETQRNTECESIKEEIQNLLNAEQPDYYKRCDKERKLNQELSKLEENLKDLREKIIQQEHVVREIVKCEVEILRSSVSVIGERFSSKLAKIIQLVDKIFNQNKHETQLNLHDVAIKYMNSTFTSGEKKTVEDIFSEIQKTVESMNKRNEFSNLHEILGESKLWKMIEEINQFGLCVCNSLVRSLETFSHILFESEKDKKIKNEAISIGGNIKRLVDQVIYEKEQSNELKHPDEIANTVKEIFGKLKIIKDEFPEGGRKLIQIYINQLDDTLRNVAKYLSIEPALTDAFLHEIGEFEVGNLEKKNLKETIKGYNLSTIFYEDGISLSTLKQLFSVMNSIHELGDSSCIAALLNLSNALYHFKVFLQKFTIVLKECFPLPLNYQMIIKLVDNFCMLFGVSIKVEANVLKSLENGFGSALSFNATKIAKNSSNFIFEFTQSVEYFEEVLCESKELCQNMKRSIDFILEQIILVITKHQFKQFSQLFCQKLLPEPSKSDVAYDLQIKFLHGAMKQLITFSRNHFTKENLFESTEERFRELIITILNFLKTLPKKFDDTISTGSSEFCKFIETSLLTDNQFFFLIQRGYEKKIQIQINKLLIVKLINSFQHELTCCLKSWNDQWFVLTVQRQEAEDLFNRKKKEEIENKKAAKKKKFEDDTKEYEAFKLTSAARLQDSFYSLKMCTVFPENLNQNRVFRLTDRLKEELGRLGPHALDPDDDVFKVKFKDVYRYEINLTTLKCIGDVFLQYEDKVVKLNFKFSSGYETTRTIYLQRKISLKNLYIFGKGQYNFDLVSREFDHIHVTSEHEKLSLGIEIFTTNHCDLEAGTNQKIFEGEFILYQKSNPTDLPLKIVSDSFTLVGTYDFHKLSQIDKDKIDEIEMENMKEEMKNKSFHALLQLPEKYIKELAGTKIVKKPTPLEKEEILAEEHEREHEREEESEIEKIMYEVNKELEDLISNVEESKKFQVDETFDIDAVLLFAEKFGKLLNQRKTFASLLKNTLQNLKRKEDSTKEIWRGEDFIDGGKILKLNDVWSGTQKTCIQNLCKSMDHFLVQIKDVNTQPLVEMILLFMKTMLIRYPHKMEKNMSSFEKAVSNLPLSEPNIKKIVKMVSDLKSKEFKMISAVYETYMLKITFSPETRLDIAKMFENAGKIDHLDIFDRTEKCSQFEIVFNPMVYGIPEGEKKQVVLSTANYPCTFEFGEMKNFKLSTQYGTLEKGEQTVVSFASGKVKSTEIKSLDTTLKLVITKPTGDSHEYDMILKQTIEHIDPLQHISCRNGTAICNKEGNLIIDIGKVSENLPVKRVLVISNPLSKTLRVKFVDPYKQLEFNKNEIIIQPKSEDENYFRFKAQVRQQNRLEFKLYFSEAIHYNCCINYEPIKPSCEIRIDRRHPTKSNVENIERSFLPYTSPIYNDLEILNTGKQNLQITVSLSNNAEGVVNHPPLYIKPQESFKPEIQMHLGVPEVVKINLTITVHDMDLNRVKELKARLNLNIGWPELKVKTDLQSKTITISCINQPITISSIEFIGIKPVGQITYPMTVSIHKNNKIEFKYRIGSSQGILIINSNAQNPKQVEYIDSNSIHLQKQLILASPEVIDISKMPKKITTVSNKSDCWIEFSSSDLSFKTDQRINRKEEKNIECDIDKTKGKYPIIRFLKKGTICLEIPVIAAKQTHVTSCRANLKEGFTKSLEEVISLFFEDDSIKLFSAAILPIIFKLVLVNDVSSLVIILSNLKAKNLAGVATFLTDHFPHIFDEKDKSIILNWKNKAKKSKLIASNLSQKVYMYPLEAMTNFTQDKNITAIHRIIAKLYYHYYSTNTDLACEVMHLLPSINKIELYDQLQLILNVLEAKQFAWDRGIEKASSVFNVLTKMIKFDPKKKDILMESQFESDLLDRIRKIENFCFDLNRKDPTNKVKEMVKKSSGFPIGVQETFEELNVKICLDIEKQLESLRDKPSLPDIIKVVNSFQTDDIFSVLISKDISAEQAILKVSMQLLKDGTKGKEILSNLVECLGKNQPLGGTVEKDDMFSIVWKSVSVLIPNSLEEEPYDIFELRRVFFEVCESVSFNTALNKAKILENETNVKIDAILKFLSFTEDYGTRIIKTCSKPSVKAIHNFIEEKNILSVPKTYEDIIKKRRSTKISVDLLLEISKEVECDGFIKDILESIPTSTLYNPFKVLERLSKYSNPTLVTLIKIAEYCYHKMKKDKDAEEILNEVHCKEDVIAEARNFPNEEGKSLTHFFFVISKDLDFQEVERLQVKKMIEYILKFEKVFTHTNEELFQFICHLLKIFCEDFKSEIEFFEHFTKKVLDPNENNLFINEALVFYMW